MNDSELPNAAPDGADGGDLEFKPWVKYAAVGVLAAGMLGFGTLLFCMGQSQGYHEGYNEGIASGKVTEEINTKAVENLTRFMQSAAADDARLDRMAADPAAELAWIKDPKIHAEAEWLLAQTLLERGKDQAAVQLLAKLFQQVPREELWARRAMTAADAFARRLNTASARAYYRYAADTFAEQGTQEELRVQALNGLFAAIIADAGTGEEPASELDALLDELGKPTELTAPLRASILVYLGQSRRERGMEAEARRCFEAIPARKDAGAAEQVCQGIAALELGNREKAQQLLKAGEQRLTPTVADSLCRIFALRGLARMAAEQNGGTAQALTYLNRAAGVADVIMTEDNAFWPVLYDQRGWLYYTEEDYAAAEQDFAKALALTQVPSYRLQPLEGAGRCAAMLNKTEDALRFFEECVTLRRQHAAADKNALGRTLLLLAQSYDQKGDKAAARKAYEESCNLLGTLDTDDARANARTALLGYAYTVLQLKDYAAALPAWTQIEKVYADRPDTVETARGFIRECRLKLGEN